MTATSAQAITSLRANRDFRLLWVGGLLGNLGSQMGALALPLLVLAETHSPGWAGMVGSVSAAATLITLIPGGAVADATERRRLMIGCELAAAGTAASLTVVALTHRAALSLIVLAAVLSAALGSVYGPAASALLRAAVPSDHIGSAMSYLQARSATARLAGPLLGGLLFGVDPALPFAAQTAGLLVSGGCLLAVRTRARPAGAGPSPLHPRPILAGLTFLWRHPFLRAALVIAGAGLNAAFGAVLLAAITGAARHDPSGRSSGLISALAGAGALVGALAATRLKARQHTRSAILVACWTSAVAVSLLTLAPGSVVIALLVCCCLVTATVANVAFAATMLVVTPDGLVGRVQAAAAFVSLAAQPLGPLAGGLLLEHVGEQTTFGILAGVLTIGALAATVAKGLKTAA